MGFGKGDGGVVAGSMVSAGFAICFCSVGIPVIFTGAIMMIVTESGSTIWTVGLVLLLLSGLVLICGIILVLLLCTDCCGKQTSERASVYPQPINITTVSVPPQHLVQPIQPPTYGQAVNAPPYSQPTQHVTPSQPHPSQPGHHSNAETPGCPPPLTAAYSSPPMGNPPPPSEKPPAYY